MATLVSYALTSVSDVKESLGIDSGDTSQDNLIIRKINQATEVIESYCNLSNAHHFKEATYTGELYDGSGDQVVLKMRPVSAVSSFQYRTTSANNNDFDDVESELYFVDGDAGTIDGLFTQLRTWSQYKVTYTAGFATIPYDLSEACATLASYYVQNATSGTAIKRKREGQREIEYFAASGGNQGGSGSIISDLSLDDVLNRYVRYTLGE